MNPPSLPPPGSDRHWTRRAWLAASLGGLAAIGCSRQKSITAAGDEGVIRILLPAGFFASRQYENDSNLVRDQDSPMNVVAEFEEESGIKTDITYFSSSEELAHALANEDAPYHVAMLSVFASKRLYSLGWLAPLSPTEIPNILGVNAKRFRLAFDPNLSMTVPYFWSAVGIGYNIDYVDGLPMSWGDFFARNWSRDATKLNVAIFDNGPAVLATTLIHLGYSPETTNAQEIEAAGKLLTASRDRFGSIELQIREKLRNGSVHLALALSADVAHATRANKRVRLALPRDGSVVISSSLVALRPPSERPALGTNDAPGGNSTPGQASKFIDYMLRPEVVARLTNLSNFATTVADALPSISHSITHGAAYFSNANGKDFHLERIETPTMAVYDRVWREVKSKWS